MGQSADEMNRLDGTAPSSGASGGAEDPTAIRADIEQTRASMGETIDAIQEKLNPQTLSEQAKEALREATLGRAEATLGDAVDRAEDAVYTATESAREVGYTMMDTVRQNPIPSLLAGLGLGWLFMNRAPRRRAYRPYYSEYYRQRDFTGQGPRFRQEERGPMDEVTSRMGQTAERVGQTAEQAQERAGEMVGNAGEAAREATSTVGDLIRQNPLPTALVGLGLGWLAMNSGSSSRPRYGTHDATYSDYYETYPRSYAEYSGQTGGVRERAGETAERARDTVGEVVGKAQETAGQAVDQVQETAEQLTTQMQQTVGGLTRETQYRASRVEDQVQDLLRTNPLAVGAAALAVGAALGLAMPATQREQELMGEARDNFMEQAREKAEEVRQKAQRVADEMQSTGQEEARKQGLGG